MLFITLFRFGGIHMPNVNELLEIAKAEINHLNPGEVFLLRDLFKGMNGTECQEVIGFY